MRGSAVLVRNSIFPNRRARCHTATMCDDVYMSEMGDMKNYLTTGLLEKPVSP